MGWIECLRGGDEHMWVGHFSCFHSCLMSIVYSWFYHLHRTPLLLSSFCNPYVRITSSLPSMVLPLDPRPIISLAQFLTFLLSSLTGRKSSSSLSTWPSVGSTNGGAFWDPLKDFLSVVNGNHWKASI